MSIINFFSAYFRDVESIDANTARRLNGLSRRIFDLENRLEEERKRIDTLEDHEERK